jgi:hypothetical protein
MIFSHITKLIFTAQYLQWVALDQPLAPGNFGAQKIVKNFSMEGRVARLRNWELKLRKFWEKGEKGNISCNQAFDNIPFNGQAYKLYTSREWTKNSLHAEHQILEEYPIDKIGFESINQSINQSSNLSWIFFFVL